MRSWSREGGESVRLAALEGYDLLDTLPEQGFDELTELAATICEAPIALMSLLDEQRVWFKSKVGLALSQIPRDTSFCGHALLGSDLLIVPDALEDQRFANNPMVTGEPHARFYAGAPLLTTEGVVLGTLCIIDTVPRQLQPQQERALRMLSRQVMIAVELRRCNASQNRPLKLRQAQVQLQEQLRERDGQLRLYAEQSLGAVAMFDREMNYLAASRGWMEAFKLEMPSLVGRNHYEVFPDLPPSWIAAHRRCLAGEIQRNDVDTFVRTDGTTHWSRWEVRPWFESDDSVGGVVIFSEDITATKQLEQALRSTETDYRVLFKSASDGILVSATEGVVLDANLAACRMLGYSREELLTLRRSDLVISEERARIEPEMARLAAGQVARTERQFCRKDGTILPVEISATVLPDGRLLSLLRDITERRQAERRIEHLNRTFEMSNAINQAILRQDDTQVILEAACRIGVEKGAFRMAWVGMADPDRHLVQPVASAGFVDGYLQGLNIDLLDKAESAGPCAQAFLSGKRVVCGDIDTDPLFAPWRDSALRRGYRAVASFPITIEDKTVGVYNLYSDEPGFFEAEELRLFDELAADISFALEVGRRKTERLASVARHGRQRDALIALTHKQRALDTKDVLAGLQQIAESAARTLEVKRVSIWRFNEDHSVLECVDLFESESGNHTSGGTLSGTSYPTYFRALEKIEVLAADDAMANPWTSEFVVEYLTPLDIRAMLDAPISVGGVRIGVLCHEHLGTPRRWTEDEKTFAVAMANLVSLTLEGEERRLAELALEESEARLSGALRAAHLAYWDYDVATDRFIFNDHVYRLLRTTVDSEGGYVMSSSEFAGRFFHPNEGDLVALELNQARLATEPEYNRQIEHRVIFADGNEGYFAGRIFQGKDSEGRTVKIRGITQDITERKNAEQRFRALIEHSADGITLIDTENRILYASPSVSTVEGYSPEELIGGNGLDHTHPDDLPLVQKIVQKLLENPGKPIPVLWRRQHKEGHWLWLEGVATNLLDDPAVGAIVTNYRDVTARRELEALFRQSQKLEAIGQLAGGVAHDFNNILTVIRGYGSLLLEQQDNSPETVGATQQIVEAAERATNLTRQLLAFSRRQVMQTRPLDLNEVVTSVTRMLQRILGEDVRLQLRLHPSPLMVLADAGMLDQVLLNLVVNSRDAMPDGGNLIVETGQKRFTVEEAATLAEASPGDHVYLRVTDTGCGIAPENLARIFEPFYTTKETSLGTGLGLSTVFGIVKQHGGSLAVESVMGKGTTLEVFLPVSSAVAESPKVIVANPKPLAGTETILLVEDEPSVRRLTRAVLERAGYKVFQAAHGFEALDVWEQHSVTIQLLFTDMVMPEGLSGIQLASELRKRDPKLRVVITSGYSSDIAGQELSLQEGQTFLQKPASPREMLEAVRRCLDA